jgi:hypothetical protein
VEVDRTGIYILYGPDQQDPLKMRAYIGEADSVRDRIAQSANSRSFWETAVVVTTSDEALTKGHVRYLEARLIEMTRSAGRVALDNAQEPDADRRRLPEADRANMEAFLANLRVMLPMVNLELLKPRPSVVVAPKSAPPPSEIHFLIQHRLGAKAFAVEEEGEFVVLAGSRALKDSPFKQNGYAALKRELVDRGILRANSEDGMYEFTSAYPFKSPSAAAAVVLDRSANGRTEWKVEGSDRTYSDWQLTVAQPEETA